MEKMESSVKSTEAAAHAQRGLAVDALQGLVKTLTHGIALTPIVKIGIRIPGLSMVCRLPQVLSIGMSNRRVSGSCAMSALSYSLPFGRLSALPL